MDATHQRLVAALASEVKKFYAQQRPFRVYHGSTNSTRVLDFNRSEMVDVSRFDRVLGVDTKRRTALVEANVPMDRLVDATLAHGLVPPVVMEFPGITVGGGLQGGAGESSSFRWGTFNRTLNWFEIVLADGRVLRPSRTAHADLFWGAAGAYGSLGVVAAAEVQLLPAKRYVQVTYIPVGSFSEATERTVELTKHAKNIDFIDGILFSRDCGVIILGKMSDEPQGPLVHFNQSRDPWFYLHAEKLARANKEHHETVELKDYLFRYDRGAFWMGKHAFARFGVPFNRFTRWLLDPLLHTRRMYEALQASGISQECIIQDIAMPATQTTGFLKFIDHTFEIYPLWLCPLLPDAKSPLLSSSVDAKAIINVGVWSLYSRSQEEFIRANRTLEQGIQRFGGKKWLYAHSFYTPKEFWKLYDKTWYDNLRSKYHATTLPDVYEKAGKQKLAKVSAKRGALFALLGLRGIRVK
jgi:hypothetical protein